MSVYLDLSIATGDHVQLVDWLSVPGLSIHISSSERKGSMHG